MVAEVHFFGRVPARAGSKVAQDGGALDRRMQPMTSTAEDMRDVRPRRQRVSILLVIGLCLPGAVARLAGLSAGVGLMALIFGLAIVGAAFLLSWAAEVAQLDMSAGLAIALLAFIAVLPEYAVDLVFAWKNRRARWPWPT